MAERIDGVYLPRNIKASPLYGLVEDHFDDFEQVYKERFADKHGFWRPVIRKVADRFLNCGDLHHGFARIRCENPDCRHEDQTVVRKILQHLGIWETLPRPPPKKITSSPTVEPIPQDCLPWAADPVFSYDGPDPVYPD